MTQDIAEQRDRLETLRDRERQLRKLRAREGELEVERIATEAALGPTRSVARPDLSPQAASAIADALDRRDELQERIRDLEQLLSRTPNAVRDQRRRRQSGAEALRDWLEAPEAGEPSRVQLVVKAVLVVVTVTILYLAWTVHLAFLVLLFPLVGATSFMLGSNQDVKWRRLGAQRHFEASGLEPPPDWDEPTVRARAQSLADELEALSRPRPSTVDEARDVPAELDATSLLLREENENLGAALISAGLTMEALDEDFASWVRLVTEAQRARQELERVRARRKAAARELDTAREDLFRFLARHGEAPTGGIAEIGELAAGLERVAGRSRGG